MTVSDDPVGGADLPVADVLDHLPDAVLLAGPGGKPLVFASASLRRVTGVSPERFRERWPVGWVEAFVHPEDRETVAQRFLQAVSTAGADRAAETEFRFCAGGSGGGRKDVSWRCLSVRFWPRTAPDGAPGGLLCLLRDVTEEKRVLVEQSETQARYSTLFHALPEAVLVLDRESRRILDANATALGRYGYARDELLRLSFTDLEVRGAAVNAKIPTLVETRVGDGPVRPYAHRTRDGHEFPVDLHVGQTSVDGRPALLAVAVDVSERAQVEQEFRGMHEEAVRRGRELEAALEDLRRTQDRLVQAFKMEAVAHLAGRLAHEFNNLLTVVLGTLDLLAVELPPDHSLMPNIDAAQNAAAKAAELTRGLRALQQDRPADMRVIPAGELVRRVTEPIRRMLPESVRLVVRAPTDLPGVRGDISLLESALLSLAANARDALADHGTLRIDADLLQIDDAYVRAHPDAARGLHLRIRVADDGCGMSQDVRDHLFEPFFSTRRESGGTGLGLASVFATVRSHGGHVTAESEEGVGSTFTILLPATETPAPRRPTGDQALPGAGELVLVVDDDLGVLQTAERILTRLGYRVLPANSGAEALSLFDIARTPVAVALLDIVMPEMGGVAALRRLRDKRPGLPAVLMTGHAGRGFVPAVDLGVEILSKPFDIVRLSVAIRRALDEAADAAAADLPPGE